jgi:nicotinamidase/pyrazinamidase
MPSDRDPSDLLRAGDALVLIDVQKDFCPGGRLPVPGGDEVVPILNRWLAAAAERGVHVVASRDCHPSNHMSFAEQGGPWPVHCVEGSDGVAFHGSLALPANVEVVSKGARQDHDQNSAFDGTDLAARLRQRNVLRLWIGGLARDVCVRATVLDALREGFDVHVIADATRPVNPGRDTSLADMEKAGAIIELAAGQAGPV